MPAGSRRPALPLAVVAVVLALLTAFAAATSPARADRLADARAEADQVQADLETLDMRLATAQEQYNDAQQRLEDTRVAIAENTRRLAIAKTNLGTAQAQLSESLVEAYRRGDADVVQVVLGARTLDQMLSELSLARRVSQGTRVLVEEITGYEREVKSRGAELAKQEDARQQAVADRAAKKREVEGMLADRRARLASVRSEIRTIIAEREAAQRRAEAAAAAAARARVQAAQAQTQSADQPTIGGSGDAGDGGGGGEPPPIAAPPSSGVGGSAASAALGELGVPYVWGGDSPSGFDCSGLVVWAFAQAGMGGLPHSTYALWGMGAPVDRSQLEAGDLVFFYGQGHVGIYIGDGQFVHAPHTGDVVKVSSLDGYPSYDGARRIG